MDLGTVLRGLGVGRSVLGFLGWRRVGWAVAIAISLGWFFLSAGRANAATGTVAGTGIVGTFGTGAVEFWLHFAGRAWVIGTSLSLGIILGGVAVYAVRAESERSRWAGDDDGPGNWRVQPGHPMRHDDLDGTGGGAAGGGAAARGAHVGPSREHLGA